MMMIYLGNIIEGTGIISGDAVRCFNLIRQRQGSKTARQKHQRFILVVGFQQQRGEMDSTEVRSIEIRIDILLQAIDSNFQRVSPSRKHACIIDDAVEGGDLLGCYFEGVCVCGIGREDLDAVVAGGGEGLEFSGFGGVPGCGEDCCGGVLGELWAGELVLYSFLLCLRGTDSLANKFKPDTSSSTNDQDVAWRGHFMLDESVGAVRTFDEVEI